MVEIAFCLWPLPASRGKGWARQFSGWPFTHPWFLLYHQIIQLSYSNKDCMFLITMINLYFFLWFPTIKKRLGRTLSFCLLDEFFNCNSVLTQFNFPIKKTFKNNYTYDNHLHFLFLPFCQWLSFTAENVLDKGKCLDIKYFLIAKAKSIWNILIWAVII